MEKNKEMLQEFFFKKKEMKISDKMKKKYGYEPLDARKEGQPGFGSIISPLENGLAVTDAKEAGKRVVSALGASLGVNSLKNIASKSIKSFPIIVSDNIEPETTVMLKRVLEEQYAEYISLLISNQVVDITAFKTSGEEGNIAVQALGKIAADDESVESKLARGKVAPEDLLGNLTAFNLIRNESYKTNNALLDTLLEGAFIVPAESADSLMEFYHRNYNDIVSLNETDARENKGSESENKEKGKLITVQDFFLQSNLGDAQKIENAKNAFNKLRGRVDEEENPAWTRWNSYLTSLEARITSLEQELEGYRKTLRAPSDTRQSQDNVARLQKELDKRIMERRQMNSKSAEDRELKDLDITYAREALERAESALDPDVQNRRTSSLIRTVENEIEKLTKERDGHLRMEPSRKIEKFNRLSTPRILLDRDQMDKAMNSSIGQLILEPKNEFLRDRFEKATFLLESNRIAGIEYIEYLVQRLGIPVAADVRGQLLQKFKIKDIVDPTNRKKKISKKDVSRIYANRVITKKIITRIAEPSGRTLLTAVLLGAGAAAGTAATTGASGAITSAIFGPTAAASLPAILGIPFATIFAPALAGVGVAALSTLLMTIFKKKRSFSSASGRIQGWERVESLIDVMDDQQASLRKIGIKRDIPSDTLEGDENYEFMSKEFRAVMADYRENMSNILNIKPKEEPKSNKTNVNAHFLPIYDVTLENLIEGIEIVEELTNAVVLNEDYKAAVLQEAVIQTTIPQTLELKYEYDPKKAPEILAAPKFSQRSQYAYGTVEYEKKDLKDRRFNAPLLMKVSFRERFSDGTFADNELVAVIGILGVITRVPTQEMEYILKSNAEGETVKGIIAPEGDPSKMIADIIGIEKIKKDVKNLPMSSDVWQKLEKVSRLAVSNRLAGRKDNNIANAHIVFAQKEIDNVRADEGVDYMKNIKLAASLMKRYSAFTVMIANDVTERLYIFEDLKAVNWDVAPYSVLRNKDTGDQLNAFVNKLSSGRL